MFVIIKNILFTKVWPICIFKANGSLAKPKIFRQSNQLIWVNIFDL
jgi:hypothetical protein